METCLCTFPAVSQTLAQRIRMMSVVVAELCMNVDAVGHLSVLELFVLKNGCIS